jgi:hypothetical protein
MAGARADIADAWPPADEPCAPAEKERPRPTRRPLMETRVWAMRRHQLSEHRVRMGQKPRADPQERATRLVAKVPDRIRHVSRDGHQVERDCR